MESQRNYNKVFTPGETFEVVADDHTFGQGYTYCIDELAPGKLVWVWRLWTNIRATNVSVRFWVLDEETLAMGSLPRAEDCKEIVTVDTTFGPGSDLYITCKEQRYSTNRRLNKYIRKKLPEIDQDLKNPALPFFPQMKL